MNGVFDWLPRYTRSSLGKRCVALTALILLMNVALPVSSAETKQHRIEDVITHAQSALLMDADSGTILLEKNKDQQLPLASITKIMTMLLIMEAIEQGKITYTELVSTSEYAASMGGSQIFLKAGEEMSVKDMLKGIALASGNDASVAMAEKLAGSEALFVDMMNERATQLKMNNTHFANCNGLPKENHYSTAQDIAIMSRVLLKHKEITSFTGMYQDYLRKDQLQPFWLVNTNKLVRFYQGADGLKTGYTQEAKFCLSATAKRDNFRIIAVVMGEPNTTTRNHEVSQLFDYAFAQYQSYPVIHKGDRLGDVPIANGEIAELPIMAIDDYGLLMNKGESTANVRFELQIDAFVIAPLHEGQPIGKLVIYHNDLVKREVSVTSPVSVAKASWWTLCKRKVRNLW